MTHRIFSKNRNKYLPQDKYGVLGNGRIVEFSTTEAAFYDEKDFIVEAWTGYFDKNNKKIYLGDIVEMYSMFDFKSKIIWKHGGFIMECMDTEGYDEKMGDSGILKGWVVTGNIHGIEHLTEN